MGEDIINEKPKLKPMCRLTKEQIDQKKMFIDNYIQSSNASTGSLMDANANVAVKTVATLGAEVYKDMCIQINRSTMKDYITKYFDKETADEYIDLLEEHTLYKHDETCFAPGVPYCVAISMYPFLEHGMTTLGGESKAPKHLESFCGSFINLCFAISSQFAGAVATVEWLMYFDHFARKDYGEDYLNTHKDSIIAKFQHTVYSLNQPAAARGYQCVRENTQLWTPEGFKFLSELKEGDECYTWNNGKFRKSKIKKLNVYDYDGKLIQFRGRSFQETVTPNHRVFYKVPNTQNKYNLREAKDLVGHSKLSIPICSDNDFTDYPMDDSLLRCCTFALTDGIFGLNEDGTPTKLRYAMSPNRTGLAILKEDLDKLGIGYTETKCASNMYGEVHNVTIPAVEAQIIERQLKHTKKEIPFFFKMLSQRQANIVLDAWARTDGQFVKESEAKYLQCDSMEIAEALQEVVLLAGYGSEIISRKCRRITNPDEFTETIYVHVLARDAKRVSEYNTIHYKGKVWCPTTDDGVVVFREENMMPYISGNSIFWNISVFDKYYFDAIFGNFYFPDGSQPNYESLRKLQYFFMEWFTEERTKSLLTFPVLTESSLNNEDGTPKDLEFAEKMAEFRANGLSFFSYNDTNASALSSCCRLRNSIENDDEDNEFAYTLGGVGVATGSTSVMTLNFNRVAQKAIRRYLKNQDPDKPLTKGYIHSFINNNYVQAEALFFNKVEELVKKIHKYQFAHRQIVEDYIKSGMLPAYTAGYITTNKQFCTIGISGLNECAEFMGYKVANNSDYKDFIARLLGILTRLNKEARKIYKIKFNSEFIPGENLGIKNAKWDKKDNLEVPRDCYNSYFYLSESDTTSIPDKFQMHGDPIASHIDGGSALHLNLSQLPDKEFFLWLRNLAGKYGCNYWTTNVLETMCEDCGHNDFRTLDECPVCGSKHVSYASRIIGYLKKIDSYSEGRKIEASKRYYH